MRRSVKSGFVATFVRRKINNCVCGAALFALSLFASACGHRSNSVSGTIEVDEVHVGPRSGGRVEKIFAWEGDTLRAGQPIVELDASELHARRDLAEAQINTAIHDADSQAAQLEFLRDDARRQQDLLKRKVVSPNDAERAGSSARAQEKNVEAAKMRVTQARAQLADIDAQLAEMQVTAPADDFEGTVEQISRQAEFTPRNVQTVADRIKQVFGVKIRLPSDDDHLRAGMAADVYFPNVK